jgi:hypothetical protein
MELGSSVLVGMLLSAIIPLAVAATIGVVLFKFLNRTLRPALGLLQTQDTCAAQRKMKDPVEGEFVLTGSSIAAPHAAYQTCSITGVISAPGMPTVPANYRGLVSTSKFPRAGQTLPVLVDRTDPENFVIQWAKVADGAEKAMSAAQALADEMNRRSRR